MWTINFTDFPSLVPNSNKIWGIFVKYNEGSSSFELAGVDTDLVGAFTFVEPELSGDWFVRWESGKAPNSYSWLWSSRPGYTYTQALLDPVYLSNAATGCVPGPTTCTPFQVTGPATTVTFSRVPEPASSGLVLAALGAAWWAGRRRRPA